MPRVHWRAGRGRLTPTSFKSCQSDQPSPESKVEPQLANDKAAGESSGASYCLLYLLLARILSDSVVPLCLGCIHSFGRQLWGSLPPQLLPLLSPTSQVWSLKHFFFTYLFATDVLLWRCRGQWSNGGLSLLTAIQWIRKKWPTAWNSVCFFLDEEGSMICPSGKSINFIPRVIGEKIELTGRTCDV